MVTCKGYSFHLVPNNMGFNHGPILIEMETDSLIGVDCRWVLIEGFLPTGK